MKIFAGYSSLLRAKAIPPNASRNSKKYVIYVYLLRNLIDLLLGNVKSPESKLTGRKRKRDEESDDDSYAESDASSRDESSSASVSEEEDVSESEESSVSERPKKKQKTGKFQAKKKEYEVPKVN